MEFYAKELMLIEYYDDVTKKIVTAQGPSPSRGGKEGMGLVTPVVFSKACSVGPSPPRLPLKGRGISAPTRPVYLINEIVFSNRFDYLFKERVPEQLQKTLVFLTNNFNLSADTIAQIIGLIVYPVKTIRDRSIVFSCLWSRKEGVDVHKTDIQ